MRVFGRREFAVYRNNDMKQAWSASSEYFNSSDRSSKSIEYGKNVRHRVALSVVSVFQHDTECSIHLSIVYPRSLQHPVRVDFPLATQHQEYRTTGFVKRFIDVIPLQDKSKIFRRVWSGKTISFHCIPYIGIDLVIQYPLPMPRFRFPFLPAFT